MNPSRDDLVLVFAHLDSANELGSQICGPGENRTLIGRLKVDYSTIELRALVPAFIIEELVNLLP